MSRSALPKWNRTTTREVYIVLLRSKSKPSHHVRSAWRLVAFAAVLSGVLSVMPGCFLFKRVHDPIPSATHRRAPDRIAPCLFVMLPGFGDSGEDYESHGFVRAVEAGGIDADVVMVDAHYKYYKRRSVIARLHEDVLAPARRQGYARIVLLGASMGGVGVVGTAREHPEDVDALVLLSPYLGKTEVVRRVRDVGLARYTPEDPDDFFQKNWAYLGGYARGDARPRIALGYGASEGLVPALEVLKPFVPTEHLSVIDGGHGWRTWTPIFEGWARDGTLAALCSTDAESAAR